MKQWYSSSVISTKREVSACSGLKHSPSVWGLKGKDERMDLSTNQLQEASVLIPGYGKKPICVALKLTCLKSKSWLIQSSALFKMKKNA